MGLQGFQSYRGYFYRVSANCNPAGEWRGTIDIRSKRQNGIAEPDVSYADVPGQFRSKDEACEAADAYARVIIDQRQFDIES